MNNNIDVTIKNKFYSINFDVVIRACHSFVLLLFNNCVTIIKIHLIPFAIRESLLLWAQNITMFCFAG